MVPPGSDTLQRGWDDMDRTLISVDTVERTVALGVILIADAAVTHGRQLLRLAGGPELFGVEAGPRRSPADSHVATTRGPSATFRRTQGSTLKHRLMRRAPTVAYRWPVAGVEAPLETTRRSRP